MRARRKTRSTAKLLDEAYKRILEAHNFGIKVTRVEDVPDTADLEKREDIKLTKRRKDLIMGLRADIELVRRYTPHVLDRMEG